MINTEIRQGTRDIDVAKELATEVTLYGIEQYEAFPTLLEDHFGGSQRAAVLAAASGITFAFANGHSQIGLAAGILSMLLHKEAWADWDSSATSCRIMRSNQCVLLPVRRGHPLELRVPTTRIYAMNVGHQGEYAGITSAAHAGRMKPSPSTHCQGHLRQSRSGLRLYQCPRLLRQGRCTRVPRCRRESLVMPAV